MYESRYVSLFSQQTYSMLCFRHRKLSSDKTRCFIAITPQYNEMLFISLSSPCLIFKAVLLRQTDMRGGLGLVRERLLFVF